MAIIIDGGKIMTVAAAKAQGLPFPVGLHDESTFTVRPQRPASSAPARHAPPAAAKPAAPRAEVRAGGFGAPVAPAAKKTVKHVTRHHETELEIVDDDKDDEDPDDDDEDDRDDEEDEDEKGGRESLAAQGRAHAALSDEKRLRRLHASASLEAQTDKERFAARVIAAARGETEKPRFQIGGEISERPDPHRIQGFIDGSRIPQGLRGASFQAPMPTSTPPGRSPLHNRGGK